jgi:hypothetical protein
LEEEDEADRIWLVHCCRDWQIRLLAVVIVLCIVIWFWRV